LPRPGGETTAITLESRSGIPKRDQRLSCQCTQVYAASSSEEELSTAKAALVSCSADKRKKHFLKAEYDGMKKPCTKGLDGREVEKNEPSIDSLSDDIIYKIVCQLDPVSASAARAINRRFKSIIEDNAVWRRAMQNYVGEECTAHLSDSHPDISMEELVKKVVSLDGLRWTSRKVGGKVHPSRCNFSACAIGSKIVIFGGDHCQQALNDTHVLDISLSKPVWKKLHTRNDPPGRFGHTLKALDSSHLILFGGCGNSGLHNDTYILNIDDPTPVWSQVVASNLPEGRVWHASCVVQSSKLVVFGGCDKVGELLNDMLVLNVFDETPTWRKIETKWQPPARIGHSLAVSCETEIVVFGGIATVGLVRARDNSTFVIDIGEKHPTWKKCHADVHQNTVNLPSPRLDHVCWRLPDNRQIIFGGSASVFGSKDINLSEAYNPGVYLLNTKKANAGWRKVKIQGDGPISAWTHCACIVDHGTKCIILGGVKGEDWLVNQLHELRMVG